MVSACNRGVSAFTFADDRNPGSTVELRDNGRRRPEDESRIIPDGKLPFRFELKEPITGISDGSVLAIDVSNIIASESPDNDSSDDEAPSGEIIVSRVDGSTARLSIGDRIAFGPPPGIAGRDRRYRLLFPVSGSVDAIEFRTTGLSFTVDGILLTGDTGAVTIADDLTSVGSAFLAAIGVDGELKEVAGFSSEPVLQYRFEPTGDLPADPADWTCALTFEAPGSARREIVVPVHPGLREIYFHPGQIGFLPERIGFSRVPEGFTVVSVREYVRESTARPQTSPVPASLNAILSFPEEQWNTPDYGLFRWDLYPRILITDTVSYAVQAAMYKRAAFFLEKRGFRGRLLSVDELDGKHGWNAHNYSAEGLARFFTILEQSELAILPEELMVRSIAVENGLIIEASGEYLPGEGGLLSISRESPEELRALLLTHESLHGVFYEEPRFRAGVFRYWDTELDSREKRFWRDLFDYSGYDETDNYLMVNEFQAYVLQQPESAVNWYFSSLQVSRVVQARPAQAESYQIFLRDYPQTFRSAASYLNELLFRETGFSGGLLLE